MEWRDFTRWGVNFHSILTPVEWKFTTQWVKSCPVHSIFPPKEVITNVTTQGVKIDWIEWFFLESNAVDVLPSCSLPTPKHFLPRGGGGGGDHLLRIQNNQYNRPHNAFAEEGRGSQLCPVWHSPRYAVNAG